MTSVKLLYTKTSQDKDMHVQGYRLFLFQHNALLKVHIASSGLHELGIFM